MSSTITIRPEIEADRQAIWDVNRSAFASEAEANLVDALRDEGFVCVSLVAIRDEEIVGHILFSHLRIIAEDGVVGSVSLAPMAVLPTAQRQGVGTRLVQAGLQACRDQSHQIAVVLGHPDFYPRFGFSAEMARSLDNPFGSGEAWMAMELQPGALQGVEGRVQYPPPFAGL